MVGIEPKSMRTLCSLKISRLKVFWRRIKTRANFSKKIYHTTILIIIKSDFLNVGYVGIDPRQIKIENQSGTGSTNYARKRACDRCRNKTEGEEKQRYRT